jgi:UDP-N-acetylglucosamine transferase subunit ALG13
VTTFVSVGNATQPFQRLIDAVLRLVPCLPQPVAIQHGNTALKDARCIGQAFMGMEEFAESIARAELIIMHGGAGSIIHAIKAGKVPVVMPRLAEYGEIVDNHQLELAFALAQSGRIVLARDPSKLSEAVREAMSRQGNAGNFNKAAPLIQMVRTVLHSHAEHLRHLSVTTRETS